MDSRSKIHKTSIGVFQAGIAALLLLSLSSSDGYPQTLDHVIHISVDGLRPDAVSGLGPTLCPNFHRLMIEGIFTLNARTDFDYTNTLPNHTCQITGRGVLGPDGHDISFNEDLGGTIEDAHGSYVAGIFDVAHDNGLATVLFTGKSKFDLFDRSWDAFNGAPDVTGVDNGRDKIDHYLVMANTQALVDSFVSLIGSIRPGYAFLHLGDPDTDGHEYGWMSPEYFDAVIRMDSMIGLVLAAVEGDPVLIQSTAFVVTADHGGTEYAHDDPANPFNYTIPMFVMGPTIPAGEDIYAYNPISRRDPSLRRPNYSETTQPVRNGDSANLAADLLGFGPVPGSTIDLDQDFKVTVTEGTELPLVDIVSPADGSGFEAEVPVTVEVDASADGGVTLVEFFMDWAKVGEDDSTPWSFTFNETPLGGCVLAARAYGAAGLASVDHITVLIENVTSAETQPAWDSRATVSPNPVDQSSRIMLYLSEPGPVEIMVFDAAGRLVRKRVSSPLPEGRHSLYLDTGGFSPGVYFFRARSGEEIRSGKFVLVR